MKYRIITDSCGEIPEDLMGREEFVSVPLTLTVDGEDIVDDGHVTCEELVKKIAADPECPKTACPSPEAFMNAADCGAEHVFIVTLSAELSGSYQSAVIGMNMLLEDHPEMKSHVFNSVSASIGQTLIMKKIAELEDAGLSFEDVVIETQKYIEEKNTFFVLDNLDTLRKNGRLSRMKGLAASVLKIKPVCVGTEDGAIAQIDQARGINKAIQKMVRHVIEQTPDSEKKTLGIAHCNCPDRAVIVRDAILANMKVKDVVVLETGGVSTVYANDGGIIVVI